MNWLCAAFALVLLQRAAAEEPPPPPDVTIERHVAALGGSRALAAVRTRVTLAAVTIDGHSGRLTLLQDHRGFALESIEIAGYGTVARGYDGHRGWHTDPERGVRPIAGHALRHFLREMRLDRDANLPALYPRRRAAARLKSGGGAYDVVSVAGTEGTRETWFFDRATGLLARRDYTEVEPAGEARTVSAAYSDYRVVDGIKVPFHVEVTGEGAPRLVIRVSRMTHNETLQDACFRPASERQGRCP
jgi:hypothetical protein